MMGQDKQNKRKKNATTDHGEMILEDEIRAIRNDMGQVLQQQNLILDLQKQVAELMNEAKALKENNKKQAETITTLQQRVDNLEQYTRVEDVIISGLQIHTQTYAQATTPSEERNENAPTSEREALEDKVVDFLASKSIQLNKEDISACHFLGKPRAGSAKNIIVRFSNRKKKEALLREAKKLHGTNVYINEHLTTKNARLARMARFLRKENLIEKTWTRNGQIFVKHKGENEASTVAKISNEENFLNCKITSAQLKAAVQKLQAPSRD